ncbi:MAG TPA: phosphatase PAP2 family protein [Candidatus Deferrimicrobium sp.]|nr:phosphatase PAP2 family protein [Candidatus Deferrimicrobium sp.]
MSEKSSWKDSITWKLIFGVLIGWIVLALVFSIFDLQISIAMVNQTNPFGVFGADYGEIPGYALIGIAIVVLIGSYNSNLKKQKIGAFIFIILAIILGIVGILIDSGTLMELGGTIGFSLIAFTSITYNKDWRPYRTIALVILLLAIINPILFVNITKPLCGRIRFRDLIPPDYIGYTPWYHPPGFDLENLSFPSGHTAMGWMLLPLLIPLRDKELTMKLIGSILILGWGFFVGLSRVLVGAHYTSDVLFATGVAFITVILLYKRLYLK